MESEFLRKQLLENCSDELLSLAYLYAVRFKEFGFDITEKWKTATEQSAAIRYAQEKEHYETMKSIFSCESQEKLATTIKVIEHERECVTRNITGCNRDCANCDLVLPDKVITDSYDFALNILNGLIADNR